MLQGCQKSLTRMLQGCYIGFSMVFHDLYKGVVGVFHWCFNEVMVLQECFLGVTRLLCFIRSDMSRVMSQE